MHDFKLEAIRPPRPMPGNQGEPRPVFAGPSGVLRQTLEIAAETAMRKLNSQRSMLLMFVRTPTGLSIHAREFSVPRSCDSVGRFPTAAVPAGPGCATGAAIAHPRDGPNHSLVKVPCEQGGTPCLPWSGRIVARSTTPMTPPRVPNQPAERADFRATRTSAGPGEVARESVARHRIASSRRDQIFPDSRC